MGTRRVCCLTGVAISVALSFLSTASGYLGEVDPYNLFTEVQRSEEVHRTLENFYLAVGRSNRYGTLIYESLREKESYWGKTVQRLQNLRADFLGAKREGLWKFLSSEQRNQTTEDESFANFYGLRALIGRRVEIERNILRRILNYRPTGDPNPLILYLKSRHTLLLLMGDIVNDVAKEYRTLRLALRAVARSRETPFTESREKIAQMCTHIADYLKKQGDIFQLHLKQCVGTTSTD